MGDDVDRANWMLTGMSSVKGWIWNSWFSKPPTHGGDDKTDRARAKKDSTKTTSAAVAVAAPPLPSTRASKSATSGPSAMSTPKTAAGAGSRAAVVSTAAPPSEMDELLDSMAEDLKRCVCVIGKTLRRDSCGRRV